MILYKKGGEFWDLLFAIGLIITTMTSIRIEGLPIGIGEILLVIWMLKQWILVVSTGSIKIINNKASNILLFWYSFFIILGLGMLVSAFKGRFIFLSSMHDFIAYMFSFLLSFTLLLRNPKESIYNKMKFIVIFGTIVFTALLIWWKSISPYFLGMNLVYGGIRFTGGAINPNQLALFIVPIPAILLFFLNDKMNKKTLLGKFFLVVIFLSSVYVGLNIKSDALNATIILMVILFFTLKIYKKFGFSFNIFLINFILILIPIIVLFNIGVIEDVYNRLITCFNKLDSDGSRALLWMQGIKTAFESPIVGYGPGAQIILSSNYSMEAHNTFIDLLIQTGFIGLLIYILMLVDGLKLIRHNIYLTLAYLCLIVFSMSHFVLRQPIFWMYLALIYLVNGTKAELQ